MRTPFTDVLRSLEAAGQRTLHYATTVQSACNLLRGRYFLSGQDMHTDPSDTHATSGLPSAYGPVLLVFDAARVARVFTGDVWVVPRAGSEVPESTAGERDASPPGAQQGPASPPRFGNDRVVVFREPGDALPFCDCLSRIVVDDPCQENALGVQYYHTATAALRRAMFSIRLDVPIEKRDCGAACRCVQHYDDHKSRLARWFETTLPDPARSAA